MALARNFKATPFRANVTALNWKMPLDFNNQSDELIVTKTISHYPMELYNSSFPNKSTDSRPIEIFRGTTITGTNTATISVSGSTLTDSAANFTTNPSLKGRLLRDSNSKVHRIVSNTSTQVTLESDVANGKYVVLPDFPEDIRIQENYEADIRTEAGAGFIKNLVLFQNNGLVVKEYVQDELANLIFKDSAGSKFIIKSNTSSTIHFFSSSIPIIGNGMAVLSNFVNSQPLPYIDNFKTQQEADVREGTSLRDNKFYYYTIFTLPSNANVAQAEFSLINSGTSTQAETISFKNTNFGEILYDLWPSLHRELDSTEDLQDLMQVFGFQFDELHALIETYKLQDSDNVLVSALLPLSEQTGLSSVGYSIGADTLRRISRDMIPCWKLKGTKEGIALFIRIITTWDITDGTADFSSSIQDFLPNVEALRFFDPNLGTLNTRITATSPSFVSGGRFAKSLPGIVIPGFFTFREFVVTIPNVALYKGSSTDFSTSAGTTTMVDINNNFGSNDSLVGNFLIPNTEEINDIFEIVGNTSNSITVRGIINNRVTGGEYAVLSPLNTNRFIILNKLLPEYIPYGTRAGFVFV